MATKKTLLEKLFGVDQAKQVAASFKLKTMLRYFKALDEQNKKFIKTGKIENSQELIDATNEFKLLEINEQKKKRSSVNKENASKPRKKDKPSKSELLSYKSKYAYDNGNERGWKNAAKIDFLIDAKTINKILE